MTRPTCSCCGKEIEWPPLDYAADAPWKQCGVAEEEFAERVVLERDVCVVDGEHFFVRGNVDIPVLDGPGGMFAWGVWVSLSRESREWILEAWDRDERDGEEPRFCWLSSNLPCYSEPTSPVKARLHLRGPGRAPLIEVDREHPLGREQAAGITMDRVREFARKILGSDRPPRRHPGCGKG